MGHYVFLNGEHTHCPLCNNQYEYSIPVLNFYTKRTGGSFRPEGHSMAIVNQKEMYVWQADRFSFDNERLEDEKKAVLARIERQGDNWVLINVSGDQMVDATTSQAVAPGDHFTLADGAKLLLSKVDGCRLAYVQIANS